MTLNDFLVDKQLDAIETLPAPDNRLINVVFDGGQLRGVQLSGDVPSGMSVIRRFPIVVENNIITVDDLTFDTTQYVVLS